MATTIKMPQLGESVTEGTIERWLVKEGDQVAQYDPLFEVVTDKVNAEVPAEVGGTVTKILVGDGQTVKVGTPLAEIADEGSVAEAPAAPEPMPAAREPVAPAPDSILAVPAEPEPELVAAPPAAAPQAAEPEPVSMPTAEPVAAVAEPVAAVAEPLAAVAEPVAAVAEPVAPAELAPAGLAGDGSMRMTPAVRRLVREHGIDITQLSGSGGGGRVTRDDVLAYLAMVPVAPEPTAAPSAPVPAPAPPAVTSAAPQPAVVSAAAAPPPPAPAAEPVPAPTTGDVEWPIELDARGRPVLHAGAHIPVAQRPHGIEHHYAPLAVIDVKASHIVTPNPDDCRRTFHFPWS